MREKRSMAHPTCGQGVLPLNPFVNLFGLVERRDSVSEMNPRSSVGKQMMILSFKSRLTCAATRLVT